MLLSHLHPDHCVDLCGLYVARATDPRRRRARAVPVYGPAGTAERLARAYDLDDGPGTCSAEFDFRAWTDGSPVRRRPVHASRRTPVAHPVEAYGLRVEHGGAVAGLHRRHRPVRRRSPTLCPGRRPAALAEAAFVDGRDDPPRTST